jgi:hypothetical protein
LRRSLAVEVYHRRGKRDSLYTEKAEAKRLRFASRYTIGDFPIVWTAFIFW